MSGMMIPRKKTSAKVEIGKTSATAAKGVLTERVTRESGFRFNQALLPRVVESGLLGDN
jgi:hypothetical protein